MSYRSLTKAEVVAETIKAYFKKNNLLFVDIARNLGMTGPALSYHLNGIKFLNVETASKLSGLFGFSLRYLLLGEGELLPFEPQDTENESPEENNRTVSPVDTINAYLNTLQYKLDELDSIIKDMNVLRNAITKEMCVIRKYLSAQDNITRF